MSSIAKRLPNTISEAENSIEKSLEKLRHLPFNEDVATGLGYFHHSGYRLVVQLEEEGRKKRSTAAAANWGPEAGEIRIFFERAQEASSSQSPSQKPLPAAPLDSKPSAVVRPLMETLEVQQCIDALAEAEKAGKAFIALKWFRDEALPLQKYPWAAEPEDRQRVLGKAIESGSVRISKIPNPKNPQFPTTTISLNRSERNAGVPSRFHPVSVRGEPVSATLLRDRGEL